MLDIVPTIIMLFIVTSQELDQHNEELSKLDGEEASP